VAGPCDHGNEASDSIKGTKFLDCFLVSFDSKVNSFHYTG
jgi:hypothetical protein